MSETNPQILVTKCLDSAMLAKCSAANLAITMDSWIQVQLLEFNLTQLGQILVVTSQNAVAALVAKTAVNPAWRQTPVICVGKQTKRILQQGGWQVVESCAYVADLAKIIIHKYPNYSFTILRGNLSQPLLEQQLRQQQINFEAVMVYQTKLCSKKLKQSFAGYCFFSPSAVSSFFVNNQTANKPCFSIGKTTAARLMDYNCNVILASKPSISATLDSCINFFSKNAKK